MPSKFVKTWYLDVHDFGFMLPGLDDIKRLKDIYPDFKITCFAIPIPLEFFAPDNRKHFKEEKYKEWAKIINSYEWLEVGIHGFAHTHHECSVDYDKAIALIEAGENMFDRIGLKYKKIYCAPFWQYSYDFLMALRDKGYTVAIDRNYQRPVPKGTKTYIYNWSLEEPIVPKSDKGIGHGHCGHGQSHNNLESCYANILYNIPVDSRFGFISEDCINL